MKILLHPVAYPEVEDGPAIFWKTKASFKQKDHNWKRSSKKRVMIWTPYPKNILNTPLLTPFVPKNIQVFKIIAQKMVAGKWLFSSKLFSPWDIIHDFELQRIHKKDIVSLLTHRNDQDSLSSIDFYLIIKNQPKLTTSETCAYILFYCNSKFIIG